MTSEHRPPTSWLTGHLPGVGSGASRSVPIPKEYGPIAPWINKHINSYHGGVGEGWPLYDYIVDDDWADTGFPEGTVINTYTGTKMYSTIQGAVDAWAASAVAKSIFICPGHYDEDVVVSTAIVQPISMEGPSGCTAFIDGSITFDGLFNNVLSQEYRPPSVIRNLKVSINTGGGKGAGDLIFGQNVLHVANTIDGLSFENCHFEGTVKSISYSTSYGILVEMCSFLNCTFGAGMDDNGFVLVLEECHFEGCTFQGVVNISKASGASTSSLGLAWSSNPTTFTECLFLKGLRVGDIEAGVFSACSFQNAASTAYCVWISGGDGTYGAQVREAIFTGCHFMYENGANAEFGFITLGSTQTIGTTPWENFIVSNCTFDVPTAPTSGTNPIHVVWWLGNLVGDTPKILFANNALIEDGDGNRLEDVATTPASTTIKGAFRDSVFGPCEPPNFDVDLATGSANNLYIGTGKVIGAGASSVTIIGGGSSGTTSGILYDSAALTLGYRAFLCRFDTTIVTVATGTLALTNNATNYVEVDAAGTVSANTTAYTLGHIPLGTVVTLSSDITTITEQSATLDESLSNLYTAQSVLAATTAHTPAALTVTEQTVVGRLTGGNIAAVSMGIADNNVVQIDSADVADNEYAKFTAAGLEGRSYAEVKQDLDLEDADIKALAVTGVEAEATLDLAGDVTVAAAKTLALDHVIEKTATHGVNIEGVSLLDSFADLTEIAKPANPAANALRVYAKDDGAGVTKLYGLDSAGTETAYGAGGGSMATDPIWAAAGDIAVATGNDAAGVLTKGTDAQVLTMVAGAVAWAAAAGGLDIQTIWAYGD